MTRTANLFADGSAYEQSMGRWSQKIGVRFLEWLALPKALQWLDAGCGNGAFTEVLMQQCAPSQVTGIDPSQAQMEYAENRPGCAGANFLVGDAQAVPLPDTSVDAAVMALVISFLPDPDKAVRELARVTRPGGTVATYMWDTAGGGHPANPINAAMLALDLPRPGAPHNSAATLDRMQEIWNRAGLADVETQIIDMTVAFTDFGEFWRSNVVSTGPLGKALNNLNADETAKLQAVLRDRLSPNGAEAISYRAFANAVKGRVAS
ncbi:MAG: class I SAM-dependent methyltransferase [Hyphomicrobiales bacterium]|nr:class I SAM-dependent methyltransferase [Hyphomicrobiales bacterium]